MALTTPLTQTAPTFGVQATGPESASLLPSRLRHARPLFVGLLIGTVIVIGALTFFPALSLGPIVEHFLMHAGQLF